MVGKMVIRYFTPNEVLYHNTYDDLWVSFLGDVYDLTSFCEGYKDDILLKPILEFAGKDISHWFNADTGDVRQYFDPLTQCMMPYAPHGRFIHLPPPYPSSNWANDFGFPWWKNKTLCIGKLSQKTRHIKIINTLTSQEHIVEVCSEETINYILERYLFYNSHARSYTWKYDGNVLDMNKTLEENDITDDDETFYKFKIDDNQYMQYILLYFNDDLTIA